MLIPVAVVSSGTAEPSVVAPAVSGYDLWLDASDPATVTLDGSGLLASTCAGGVGECQIPANAVRVTRQGVTIDKNATVAWFYGKNGTSGWATGIPSVDAFLNSFTTGGMRQRPRTWSPDAWRYAKAVGG